MHGTYGSHDVTVSYVVCRTPGLLWDARRPKGIGGVHQRRSTCDVVLVAGARLPGIRAAAAEIRSEVEQIMAYEGPPVLFDERIEGVEPARIIVTEEGVLRIGERRISDGSNSRMAHATRLPRMVWAPEHPRSENNRGPGQLRKQKIANLKYNARLHIAANPI